MINLTAKERKALFIVTGILFVAVVVQLAMSYEEKSVLYDYTMQDSLFNALSGDTLAKTKNELLNKKTSAKNTKSPAAKKGLLTKKSIDINAAGSQELEKLPGIGPKTAQAIIQYREQNGLFTTLEQLTNVKRIGPKTLEKIRPFVFIQSGYTDKDSLSSPEVHDESGDR